jgi:hypothetical protein
VLLFFLNSSRNNQEVKRIIHLLVAYGLPFLLGKFIYFGGMGFELRALSLQSRQAL